MVATNLFDGIRFDAGCIFDTADVEEARYLCGAHFNPHRLTVLDQSRPLRARLDVLRIRDLALARLGWQTSVAVDPGEINNSYLVSIPLQGSIRYQYGREEFTCNAQKFALIGGSRRFRFETSPDLIQLLIRLEKEEVDRMWERLTGDRPKRDIIFDNQLQISSFAWLSIEPSLRLFADGFRGNFAFSKVPGLSEQLKQSMLTSLLMRQPHSEMEMHANRLQPSSILVEHAKQHMLESISEPITLLDVSRALAVPGRTLQLAFQNGEGMGPMQWLRNLRLHAVRDKLLSGKAASVTEAAMHFGFRHLGDFSSQYRRKFGEPPSAALQRSRRS